MIARNLTLAALAAALGVSACPAEATGPWGLIAANGTQLNGIALQGVVLGVRMQEPEEDGLDFAGGCQEDCPRNGTQLNGIALQGVALDSIRMQRPEDDGLDLSGGCQVEDRQRHAAQWHCVARRHVRTSGYSSRRRTTWT